MSQFALSSAEKLKLRLLKKAFTDQLNCFSRVITGFWSIVAKITAKKGRPLTSRTLKILVFILFGIKPINLQYPVPLLWIAVWNVPDIHEDSCLTTRRSSIYFISSITCPYFAISYFFESLLLVYYLCINLKLIFLVSVFGSLEHASAYYRVFQINCNFIKRYNFFFEKR